MPMFTVLASVLMFMTLTVAAVLVSMGMFVLMFMIVSLSRSMHMVMAVKVLMRMGTFHGWYSFKLLPKYYHPFLSHGRGALKGTCLNLRKNLLALRDRWSVQNPPVPRLDSLTNRHESAQAGQLAVRNATTSRRAFASIAQSRGFKFDF
jgi:hypothetical protein